MNYPIRFLLFAMAWLLMGPDSGGGLAAEARAQRSEEKFAPVELAPFVPSPMPVVNAMLDLAGVTEKDVVYDLGSGDGRVVIAAAKKYGVRAVGFETDPELVNKARRKARDEGVAHLVEIRQQDATTADVSEATVVTLYLYPEANMLLRPLLKEQLPPGARIVSSQFDMDEWQPAASTEVTLSEKDGDTTGEDAGWNFVLPRDYTIYLWHIDDHR